MNILHLNTRDSGGGAAIAAMRLHSGLLEAGHQSSMMVGSSSRGLSEISTVPHDWRERWLHRILPLSGLNYLEYFGSFKIPRTRPYIDSDVLNFHNLHRDYFSYLSLPRITAEKPAVWTPHDMWPLTGHCAYSYDCERWRSGCGQCPYLDVYPAVRRDATRWEWRLKDRLPDRLPGDLP